jgi:hypothetical protein
MPNQGMTIHEETLETPVKFIKKLNSHASPGASSSQSTSGQAQELLGEGLLNSRTTSSETVSGSDSISRSVTQQPSMERPGGGCIPVKGLDR